MSTRSQVEVKSKGLPWEEDALMLYHHTDGYPTHILPLIQKAYIIGSHKEYEDWRLGRAGKVASFLCAADPGVFEPEKSNELHCDIEWFYELEARNSKQGTLDESPRWFVTVYSVNGKKKRVAGPMPIEEAVKKAEEIEGGE